MSSADQTTSVELFVPAPADWITANQRRHYMAKAGLTKRWRLAARVHARAAKIPPLPTPVQITAHVHRAHTRGRWDAGNWAPTAKAVIDGLVDAGVLPDDSNLHVEGPDMRPGEPRPGRPGLTLTITHAPQGGTP